MTTLLDANVLIALLVEDHIHHDVAEKWLTATNQEFATCPITEGSLARLLIRQGQTMPTVHAFLVDLAADPRHEFWPDDISYRDVPANGIVGHRQVTDSYLAQLARSRRSRLATFDQGLAQMHRDVVDLVPSGA